MDENEKNRESIENHIVYRPFDGVSRLQVAARYTKGKFYRLQDNSEIEFVEDEMVEFVVSDYLHRRQEWAKKLVQKSKIALLPAHSTLFFAVAIHKVEAHIEACEQWEEEFRKLTVMNPDNPLHIAQRQRFRTVHWVRMNLVEGAVLELKGDKDARLCSSKVHIPYFSIEMPSINSAVAHIIKNLFPNRRSTSANVFLNVVVCDTKTVRLLDHVRSAVVADFEQNRKQEE